MQLFIQTKPFQHVDENTKAISLKVLSPDNITLNAQWLWPSLI